MYKQVKSILEGIVPSCVKRIEDGAFIPFDTANTDYQAYLVWLSEGNTPISSDE
jgi:hypothetical protein